MISLKIGYSKISSNRLLAKASDAIRKNKGEILVGVEALPEWRF